MFGSLLRVATKIVKPAISGATSVATSPVGRVVRNAAKQIPGVSAGVIAAEGISSVVSDVFDEGKSAPVTVGITDNLPRLPGQGGAAWGAKKKLAPMASRTTVPAALTTQANQLQLPNVLPLSQGEVYTRAPRGYVTVEWQGQKFFMLKAQARSMKLWKPAKKPPISVTNWESLKRAKSAVRQLKKVGKAAEEVANFKMTRTITKKESCRPKC